MDWSGFRHEISAVAHFEISGHDILIKRCAMSNVKPDVESLLKRLPDDVSVEDLQYHLYVLDKVRRGLEDARVNGTLSQEEVESRFSKWLTE